MPWSGTGGRTESQGISLHYVRTACILGNTHQIPTPHLPQKNHLLLPSAVWLIPWILPALRTRAQFNSNNHLTGGSARPLRPLRLLLGYLGTARLVPAVLTGVLVGCRATVAEGCQTGVAQPLAGQVGGWRHHLVLRHRWGTAVAAVLLCPGALHPADRGHQVRLRDILGQEQLRGPPHFALLSHSAGCPAAVLRVQLVDYPLQEPVRVGPDSPAPPDTRPVSLLPFAEAGFGAGLLAAGSAAQQRPLIPPPSWTSRRRGSVGFGQRVQVVVPRGECGA